MTEEIHIGDTGTVIEVTVMDGDDAVNISSATVKQLIFKKPSGATLTVAASFVTDGSDGKIRHTTVSGNLDEAGDWCLQALVTMPTGTWHSSLVDFKVYANL